MWNLRQNLESSGHQEKHKSHTSVGRKFAPVEGLSHDLVCAGSIYHVHFAWQVWHGQLSPRFKFNKLKSFSGVEIDQNHVDKRILGGKGFAVGRLKRHNFCPASVFMPLRCRVRPHQGHKHRQRNDTKAHVVVVVVLLLLLLLPLLLLFVAVLLLLLLLLLVAPGQVNRPKISKNSVLSGIFVPLEEKLYLRCFCSTKDENGPKHRIFKSECAEHNVFCDVCQ